MKTGKDSVRIFSEDIAFEFFGIQHRHFVMLDTPFIGYDVVCVIENPKDNKTIVASATETDNGWVAGCSDLKTYYRFCDWRRALNKMGYNVRR